MPEYLGATGITRTDAASLPAEGALPHLYAVHKHRSDIAHDAVRQRAQAHETAAAKEGNIEPPTSTCPAGLRTKVRVRNGTDKRHKREGV